MDLVLNIKAKDIKLLEESIVKKKKSANLGYKKDFLDKTQHKKH